MVARRLSVMADGVGGATGLAEPVGDPARDPLREPDWEPGTGLSLIHT